MFLVLIQEQGILLPSFLFNKMNEINKLLDNQVY